MTPQEKFQQLIEIKRSEHDFAESKLERLQTELEALEMAYETTFGDGQAIGALARRGAIAARIYDALVEAPGDGLTTAELALATGCNKGTIKQNLSQWANAGKIIRVSPGRYRADKPKEQTGE